MKISAIWKWEKVWTEHSNHRTGELVPLMRTRRSNAMLSIFNLYHTCGWIRLINMGAIVIVDGISDASPLLRAIFLIINWPRLPAGKTVYPTP